MAFRFNRWPHRLQREIALDGAHQDFVTPVVVAVARDFAVESDAIDQ
jgi:hypothetical protein